LYPYWQFNRLNCHILPYFKQKNAFSSAQKWTVSIGGLCSRGLSVAVSSSSTIPP